MTDSRHFPFFKRLLRRSPNRAVAIAAFAYAASVFAQTPVQTEGRDEIVRLESLTVTGERIARDIAATASSVQATGAAALTERAGGDALDSIFVLTPNLLFVGTGNDAPTIRGQDTTGALSGASAFLSGQQPRATIQVDGRALGANEYVYGAQGLWDVARVEIFRGPQTTTQGRNSIAGAIFVETNDPVFHRESALRAEAGDYGTRQFSGYTSGPLVADQLAFRFAFDTRDHETFVNLPARSDIGREQTRDDYDTFRGKLLWRPRFAPALSSKLTFSHTFTSGPQTEIVEAGGGLRFEDRVNPNAGFAVWTTRADAAIHDLSLRVGDGWLLTQRTVYTDTVIRRYTLPGEGVARLDGDELTSETLVRYAPPNGRVSGLLGFYAAGNEQTETIDLSAFLGLGDFRDRRRSLGIFGESTYVFAGRFEATAGLRHQRDRQDRDGSLDALSVAYDEAFTAWLPKLDLACKLTGRDRVGFAVSRGYNPGGVTVSFNTGEASEFRAETLWNYELYWRASRLNERLRVQANVFFTSIRDAQRETTVTTALPPPNDLDFRVDNAESARTSGAEVSIRYLPARSLSLEAGLGWLQTELTRFARSADGLAGKEFQRAPEFTGSAGATWRPLAAFSLSAQARYTGGYFSDDTNTAGLRVGGNVVADLKAAYRWHGARVYVYATNIFDRFYVTKLSSLTQAAVGDPRELGLGVEFTF